MQSYILVCSRGIKVGLFDSFGFPAEGTIISTGSIVRLLTSCATMTIGICLYDSKLRLYGFVSMTAVSIYSYMVKICLLRGFSCHKDRLFEKHQPCTFPDIPYTLSEGLCLLLFSTISTRWESIFQSRF